MKKKKEQAYVLGYTILGTMDVDGTKNIDIPNGLVFVGPTGKTILVDYEKDGKVAEEAMEVEVGEWGIGLAKEGFPQEVVVLIHSVKGSESMLMKALRGNMATLNDNPITMVQVLQLGLFPDLMKRMYDEYLRDIRINKTNETKEDKPKEV